MYDVRGIELMVLISDDVAITGCSVYPTGGRPACKKGAIFRFLWLVENISTSGMMPFKYLGR